MEEKQEKKSSGCFTWLFAIVLVIFVFSIVNGNKQNEPANIKTKEPKSISATQETVLSGSAAEAVQNGTLTFSEIVKRAEAIGWSTTAWQEWYYIANKTGTTMEAIEDAAAELNRRLAADEPELHEALEEIGISVSDAKAMKPEELFEKVMYGILSIEN